MWPWTCLPRAVGFIPVALLLVGCGSDATAPPTPGSFAILSGNAQSGTVGTNLGAPLVVTVKDTKGSAMLKKVDLGLVIGF